MKYIIDLQENQAILFFNGEYMNTIVPDKNEQYVFDESIGASIVKLTPYDEPKYTAEDAWKFAQKILAPPTNNNALTVDDLMDCYGTEDAYDIVCQSTYAEAREKYEVWKKAKDEIKVGDEVRHKDEPGDIMVYTGTDDPGYASCIKSNGQVVLRRADEIERTGRHFNEVAELLEKNER